MTEPTIATRKQLLLPARNELDFSYHSAVELAERGFTVLPMNGKQPVIAWKELQHRRNTEAELKKWFGPEAPERYNIGVICRELVVVDFDSESAFQWFQEKNPAAVTPLATITGSGGRHLYFRRPEASKPIGNHQKIGGLDIDLRADAKGIAVVPPSVNPITGQAYRWVTPVSEVSMDDIPEFSFLWFPKKEKRRSQVPTLSTTSDPDRNLRRIRAYVRKIESVQGQAGSKGCWRVACHLVEAGLSRDRAMEEIIAWNHECAHVRPKWSVNELKSKVDDAFKKHS